MDDSGGLMMVTSYCVTLGMSVDQGVKFYQVDQALRSLDRLAPSYFSTVMDEQKIFSPSDKQCSSKYIT